MADIHPTLRLKWISDSTLKLIADNVDGKGKTRCGLCNLEFPSKRRLRKHVKQHLLRMFCRCGFQSMSRDMVYQHQKSQYRESHGRPGDVYEVDESSFPSFEEYIGWAKDTIHLQKFEPFHTAKTVPESVVEMFIGDICNEHQGS